MNLYVYSHAPKPVHDSIEGLCGTTPLGGDGIAHHCEIVDDPKQADLFWMGQYKDTETWLLNENRFPYFSESPEKHVVDLEGDWRDEPFPEWLRSALIITGNAHIGYFNAGWRIFVRPVMSPLLMRLVRDPPEYEPPKRKIAWFRGQRDSLGTREKVKQALELSGISHEFAFNDRWMAYAAANDPLVGQYVNSMRENAITLCPRGEGMATCRFYEACAFGRLVIPISDNLFCGSRHWLSQLSASLSVELLAAGLRELWERDEWLGYPLSHYSRTYFLDVIVPYFHDPTAAFLAWREKSLHED